LELVWDGERKVELVWDDRLTREELVWDGERKVELVWEGEIKVELVWDDRLTRAPQWARMDSVCTVTRLEESVRCPLQLTLARSNRKAD
jgi:hypothetical protein